MNPFSKFILEHCRSDLTLDALMLAIACRAHQVEWTKAFLKCVSLGVKVEPSLFKALS